MTQENKEQIQRLIDGMNFEKIHAHMVLVDWRYGCGYDSKVPSIPRLQEALREVLESLFASDRPNSRCSSGGFHASRWTWENGVEYEVIFALEDYAIRL